MKISIITPTYTRPKNLLRAVKSVLAQDFENWEMIIINDSPEHDYGEFEDFLKEQNDERIKYFKNDKNYGVNYARNRGIDLVADDTDYLNFLDDDDILLENSLSAQVEILAKDKKWLLTLSQSKNKEVSFENIRINEGSIYYDYLKDYLIKRKIKGDYNQVLDYKIIKQRKIKFSKKVRQAEEWVFSMRVARYMRPYVANIYTLEKEYLDQGLTSEVNQDKNFQDRFKDFKNVLRACHEVFWEGFYPLEKVYILIKIIRGIQKLLFK